MGACWSKSGKGVSRQARAESGRCEDSHILTTSVTVSMAVYAVLRRNHLGGKRDSWKNGAMFAKSATVFPDAVPFGSASGMNTRSAYETTKYWRPTCKKEHVWGA